MRYYTHEVSFPLFEYDNCDSTATETAFYNVRNFLTFADHDNAKVIITMHGDVQYTRDNEVVYKFNLMDLNEWFVMNIEGDANNVFRLNNKYSIFRYNGYDASENMMCYYDISPLLNCFPVIQTNSQSDATINLATHSEDNFFFQYDGCELRLTLSDLLGYCRCLIPTNSLGTPNIFHNEYGNPVFGYQGLHRGTDGENVFTGVVINLPAFIGEVYDEATLDFETSELHAVNHESGDEVSLVLDRIKEYELYLKDARATYYLDGRPIFTYKRSKVMGAPKRHYGDVIFYKDEFLRYNTCDLLLNIETQIIILRDRNPHAEEDTLWSGNLHTLQF